MNKTGYAIKVEEIEQKANPYFKLNFVEDLSMRNSPRLLKLKSKSPHSNRKSNSRLSLDRSLVSTSIVPSNRQYENFEKFNRLNLTLGADSYKNFHNPG